jgi:exo-beta-1,3-glucanase (GH17 family)/cellulose synthase/poly-beta-1,6-N-acetylglucosamine synthase-like glycosyltransferase
MTREPLPTPSALPAATDRLARWAVALVIALSVAAANALVWTLLQVRFEAPAHDGPVAGLAYAGAHRWHSPIAGRQPSAAEVEQDLALLSRHTRRIRTYAATEHPQLPAIAGRHGLEVMLGAGIDDRLDANRRELAAAIAAARSHANVRRLIVGNETQLKAKLPPNRLIAYLDETRTALRSTGVQVSTAEPWHVWLTQPQLAQHVDFIAVHVLPYWERVSIGAAVQTALQQIARVKARFPDREVVVAEIGWPSNGPPLGEARASAANQALFIRGFLQHARASAIDYYLIEAFDQPWKMTTEGRAGAYWGLWDTWRRPKFDGSGPVLADPRWPLKAGLSSVLGAGLMLAFLLGVPRMSLPARMAFSAIAQVVVSLGVVLLSVPLGHYLTPFDVVGVVLVVGALGFIGSTLLAQAFEFVERFWSIEPAPHASAVGPADCRSAFVSVHLACSNEPPAMVVRSVESLLALDWPAFEVIVVDNNTTRAQDREQLAAWMAQCGDARLRFEQREQLKGYKAGALNRALALTDPKAEWVAVVDADYVVDPQWLRQLAHHFHDPSVVVIQAPQAHRQWSGRRLDRMMNWETEGFFRIGMHHRHERNAIIQHGTMTLVRASELRRLRWNEDCVCEDTELGLRLLKQGHRAIYVDRVLGTGLLPKDFAAYARQRKRWAQGAMQILRLHARSLLGRSPLTLAQRYHFLAGWLPWLGDALHGLFSILMMVFSLGMVFLPNTVEPPLWLFVAPLVAFFAARLLFGPLLYTRCVPCGLGDRMGAALAGMALSHRIARGVLQGLRGRRAVFEVTPKAAPSPGGSRSIELAPGSGPAFVRGIGEEFALLTGLVFCMCLLALSRSSSDIDRLGWMAILAIQSLPYWATLACRLIEIHTAPTPVQESADRRLAAPHGRVRPPSA